MPLCNVCHCFLALPKLTSSLPLYFPNRCTAAVAKALSLGNTVAMETQGQDSMRGNVNVAIETVTTRRGNDNVRQGYFTELDVRSLTADVHRLQTPQAPLIMISGAEQERVGGWFGVHGGLGLFYVQTTFLAPSRMSKFVTMARSRIVCVLRRPRMDMLVDWSIITTFFVISFDNL